MSEAEMFLIYILIYLLIGFISHILLMRFNKKYKEVEMVVRKKNGKSATIMSACAGWPILLILSF